MTSDLVACTIFNIMLLVTCITISWSLVVSVQQKNLVKDVTICTDIVMSEYKCRYPDDTDEPQDVSLSSDDKATGMKDRLGWPGKLLSPNHLQGNHLLLQVNHWILQAQPVLLRDL